MNSGKNKQKILSLASKNSIFKMAAQSAFNHIIITDENGIIIFANTAVTRITGYTPNEIIGKSPKLWGQQMPKIFYKKLWKTIKDDKKSFSGEITNKRKNGDLYYAKATISPILNNKNNILGFIGTEEDITEKKEIDKMKSEFISITAHQLKTPLSAMNWGIELIEDESLGKLNKKQKIQLSEVREMNSKLVNLVNTMLNISRIESGKIAIKAVSFNLTSLIESNIKETEGLYKIKKQKIKKIINKNIKLVTDPTFINQVIHNLLTNAIKYSPDKSTITIKTEIFKKFVEVSITDEGIGIPKEDQRNLFKKFFRAENVKKIISEGNGLGLYFVDIILKQIKGKISFQSIEDKGTTFKIQIPLKPIKDKKGTVSLN